MLFELQVFPSQYRDALTMVDAFPDPRFVLLHAGMPHHVALFQGHHCEAFRRLARMLGVGWIGLGST